ncbi:hypothetical protein RQP46_008673 [Phenoliferia psychrophenolica]
MDSASPDFDLPLLPPELHFLIIAASVPPASFASFSERSGILRNLSLVSSQWRCWAQAMLLRDVVLPDDSASDALSATLRAAPHLSARIEHIRLAEPKATSSDEERAAQTSAVELSHLARLLKLCKPKELTIAHSPGLLNLYKVLRLAPSLEAISVSSSVVTLIGPPPDPAKSSLRRLYLTGAMFSFKQLDNPERLLNLLRDIPSFHALALTFPVIFRPDVSLSFPPLSCLSTTLADLDASFAPTCGDLLFLDCFASLIQISTAHYLPKSLKFLRLNHIPMRSDNTVYKAAAELVVALDRAGLAELRELWIPGEWNDDEIEKIQKWCTGRSVKLRAGSNLTFASRFAARGLPDFRQT